MVILLNFDTTIAGEAIGKWQMLQPMISNVTVLDDGRYLLSNILELPFRCQSAPGEMNIYSCVNVNQV